MVKNKKYIAGAVLLALIIILIICFFYFYKPKASSDSFSVNNIFLKVAVEVNKSIVNSIKITNLKDSQESFSILVSGIGNLVNVSESEFDIDANSEKEVQITFNSDGAKPDVYLGELIITSGGQEKKVPLLMEIQSKDVLFDSNINLYPQNEVVVGNKLTADIKVFDLSNIGRSNINLAYSVKDFEGNVLSSDSQDIIVDGNYPFSKEVDIPENTKPGSYVFSVVVTYKNSVGTATSLFYVVKKESVSQNDNSLILWIVIIFGFLFLVFLILFFYSIRYRDRLLTELEKQYKREIRKQNELIKSKEREDIKELMPVERKLYKREASRIKEKRINALREIHKKRLVEYERIKKKGNKKNLIIQINKWKKQGYNTSILDKKYKMPDVSDIKGKISQWKKQGYDTSVFGKIK